jgi:hypothetical protein
VCSSTIVSRILTYGAYPCTGAHCEVVGRCCVVWVDVGRCSIEGRGHGGGGVQLGWWLWPVRVSFVNTSKTPI